MLKWIWMVSNEPSECYNDILKNMLIENFIKYFNVEKVISQTDYLLPAFLIFWFTYVIHDLHHIIFSNISNCFFSIDLWMTLKQHMHDNNLRTCLCCHPFYVYDLERKKNWIHASTTWLNVVCLFNIILLKMVVST